MTRTVTNQSYYSLHQKISINERRKSIGKSLPMVSLTTDDVKINSFLSKRVSNFMNFGLQYSKRKVRCRTQGTPNQSTISYTNSKKTKKGRNMTKI
jgi:hypothetical protein